MSSNTEIQQPIEGTQKPIEEINTESNINKYDPIEAHTAVATQQIFDIEKSQESQALKYKLKYLKAKKDYYYK
jgi:hypothetical protein